MTKSYDKLDKSEARYEQIAIDLQNPTLASDQAKYTALMKEYSDLEESVVTYREYKSVRDEIASQKELLQHESDEELRDLIKAELPVLQEKLVLLEKQLDVFLLPKDPRDDRDVILEIRAGAGGDEASLFAQELFRAYSLFAESQGWRVAVDSVSEGNVGGYKEVIASISGDKVFSYLKYESGVHRVQRVPKTETQGRVHTSTVTVVVVPEADELEIKVNPQDVRVDTMRASGAGGQHINTTDSAIRLTHEPTGVVVYCQQERSQIKNKERAFKILSARLLALEEEKKQMEASSERLAQIGTGDRSERIRTYNFPQSRLTDHRVGFTTHALDAVMQGEMGPVVQAVHASFQDQALKEQS